MNTKIPDQFEHGEEGLPLPARHERPEDEDAFRHTEDPAPVKTELIGEHAPGFTGAVAGTVSELKAEILKNFRGATFTAGNVEELLDFMGEQGALAGTSLRPATPESRWRTVANRLVKVIYYLKNKTEGTGQTKSSVALYAALHIWNMPEFDALNSHQNMQQFADSVILKWVVKPEVIVDAKTGLSHTREVRTPVYLTKQAVNNAVLDAQKHFQLPPRQDQRSDPARETMREVRQGQLKK